MYTGSVCACRTTAPLPKLRCRRPRVGCYVGCIFVESNTATRGPPEPVKNVKILRTQETPAFRTRSFKGLRYLKDRRHGTKVACKFNLGVIEGYRILFPKLEASEISQLCAALENLMKTTEMLSSSLDKSLRMSRESPFTERKWNKLDSSEFQKTGNS